MSAKTTLKIHNKYSNVFTGVMCFKGTFALLVRDDTKTYQALPRHIIYVLQEEFTKVLTRLQESQILA